MSPVKCQLFSHSLFTLNILLTKKGRLCNTTYDNEFLLL